jgi:hypothetical protein
MQATRKHVAMQSGPAGEMKCNISGLIAAARRNLRRRLKFRHPKE